MYSKNNLWRFKAQGRATSNCGIAVTIVKYSVGEGDNCAAQTQEPELDRKRVAAASIKWRGSIASEPMCVGAMFDADSGRKKMGGQR